MGSKSTAKRVGRNQRSDFLASLRPITRAQRRRSPDWKPLKGYHPDVWASNQRQILSSDCHPFYEVEKILDQRISVVGDRKYKIRWLGYGPSEDSWEPAEHLYCPQKLIEFFDDRANREQSLSKIEQESVKKDREEDGIHDERAKLETEQNAIENDDAC